MKPKAFLCFLLCAALLCGCAPRMRDDSDYSAGLPQTGGSGDYRLHLLCNQNDSFNPYAVTSKENQELCYLLFDPILSLDNNFEPVYKIAQSVTVSGATCTVKLKQVNFSDGTPLTSEDVIYSMDLAARSQTRYRDQLQTVVSKQASGSDTVIIKTSKTDPYFANLLDFPIIKKGSENRKSGDNVSLPPIGAGRYIVNDQKNLLTANPSYYGGVCPIGEIELINAPGAESIAHYVSSGVVSFCYSDYSDNTVPRMSGLKVEVPLNNLVYIGINMSHPLLSNRYLRYAISSAADRTDIAENAYYGNASPAEGPFNPRWQPGRGFQTLEKKGNTQISVVNLEKIGYNKTDKAGYRINSAGKRISLTLLVNSDNPARTSAAALLVKNLADAGIELKIKSVGYAEYLSALSARDFELYLGEVKLSNNMDISSLVTPGGTAAYGVTAPVSSESNTSSLPSAGDKNTSSGAASSGDNISSAATSSVAPEDAINLTAAQAAAGFYRGEYTIGDLAAAFLSEMPVVPLVYRYGVAMFAPAFSGEPKVSISDLFIDIKNYSFEKSGGKS